jgi:hypothetical protein
MLYIVVYVLFDEFFPSTKSRNQFGVVTQGDDTKKQQAHSSRTMQSKNNHVNLILRRLILNQKP